MKRAKPRIRVGTRKMEVKGGKMSRNMERVNDE